MRALETVLIRDGSDVVRVRQQVKILSQQIGLGMVDLTKIVTAASELARNALDYGGGGKAVMEIVSSPTGLGLRLSFEDQGPGIADIGRAMTDGYSTGGGLGLGLSGAKRLSNEFEIHSRPGAGTRIVITRWK
jgi:serine/threonine-protein kinase RsbT